MNNWQFLLVRTGFGGVRNILFMVRTILKVIHRVMTVIESYQDVNANGDKGVPFFLIQSVEINC